MLLSNYSVFDNGMCVNRLIIINNQIFVQCAGNKQLMSAISRHSQRVSGGVPSWCFAVHSTQVALLNADR